MEKIGNRVLVDVMSEVKKKSHGMDQHDWWPYKMEKFWHSHMYIGRTQVKRKKEMG